MSDHARTPEGAAPTPEGAASQPEIPRSRFALGLASYPQDLSEMPVGRFSNGQQVRPTELELHRGRFSEGQEVLGDDDPEKHVRRRFSEGIETTPPPFTWPAGTVSSD